MDDMNIQNIESKEETEKTEEATFETKEKEKETFNCKVEEKHDDTGVAVFVMGLLSLLMAVLGNTLLPLVGVILGIIAWVKGSKLRKMEEKPGIITAGWIMGIVGTILGAIALVLALVAVVSALTYVAPHHYYFRYFYF